MSTLLRTKLRNNKLLYPARLLLNSRSFSSIDNGGPSDYPTEPIPNRPLRRQSSPNNPNPKFPRPNRARENENPNPSRSIDDHNFLERFKLGFDRKSEENPKPKSTNDENTPPKVEILDPPAPPQDSDEIFKKMKETGLIPNAVAMLDGLCKDGLVQEAMKLFGLMREKGSIPEIVVYTAVVEGFVKAQKYDDAIRIFKKMQSNGIVPNAFTFGVLIRGLCGGKRFEDAFGFSIEMLDSGHSLNLATFIGLIDVYCREKGLEEAQSVIAAMRQKGFFVDEKGVKEYLDKRGPFLPLVWEAILGKNASKRSMF